jgi:hypothetical protein
MVKLTKWNVEVWNMALEMKTMVMMVEVMVVCDDDNTWT